jgi:glycosyltransferase involved in cell wall biosynthesis
MDKPRVLVFIDWYKPFFKAGGPVRSMVNLVEHLQGKVDLHIVTGDRDYTATKTSSEVRTNTWVEGDKGEHIWYASPQARSLKQWKALLRERSWDVVYINGLYSKWSTIAPLWVLRGSKQRRIVAVRGMLAKGPMRQSAAKKRAFLLAMKTTGCFKGVEFQATNAEEAADIRKWIGRDTKVHVVPNLGRCIQPDAITSIPKVPGRLSLVSVARIAPEKNTLFAIERLQGVKGHVRFDLYGTVYDQGYYKQCQRAVQQLPSNVEVKFHGHIEQDEVVRVLADAHVLYMPRVGENFGHTMLEALMVGRPLLISDRTPWKELERLGAGWDIPLEEPDAFVRAVDRISAMDQATFDGWSKGAFALAVRYLKDPVTLERSYALFIP